MTKKRDVHTFVQDTKDSIPLSQSPKPMWHDERTMSPKPASSAPLKPDLSRIRPPGSAPAAVPPPKGDKK